MMRRKPSTQIGSMLVSPIPIPLKIENAYISINPFMDITNLTQGGASSSVDHPFSNKPEDNQLVHIFLKKRTNRKSWVPIKLCTYSPLDYSPRPSIQCANEKITQIFPKGTFLWCFIILEFSL